MFMITRVGGTDQHYDINTTIFEINRMLMSLGELPQDQVLSIALDIQNELFSDIKDMSLEEYREVIATNLRNRIFK